MPGILLWVIRSCIALIIIIGSFVLRSLLIIFRSISLIVRVLRFIFSFAVVAVRFIVSGFIIFFINMLHIISSPLHSSQVRAFIAGFILSLLCSIFLMSYILFHNLPDPRDIGTANYQLSSHLYDRNGRILYEFFRDQNRTPVSLSKLPLYVSQATIAIEDKHFYSHNGVSLVSGVFRAVRDTIATNNLQGGSTITQQLVKLSLLTTERTLERKLKEAVLAIRTERIFSKDRILELYLNQVPYGGNIYGIQEAAQKYYQKSADQLTLSEAAMLAGLPQSPSVYSPYTDPDRNRKRRDDVLRAMYEQGYISSASLEAALAEYPPVSAPVDTISAPHFVFYAKDELERQLGISQVETGGLVVNTTLDLQLQQTVEEILREEIDKIRPLRVSNGAVLITRPATGEILAMAGSVDFFASPSGAFNVTTALRQPGSSIKPLMYSLALLKGYTESRLIDDIPTAFVSAGSQPYRPVNYDGRFHGKITLRSALANSYNVPAVRVLQTIGVSAFIDHARMMGITTWNNPERYGLSLTLGGAEVRMVDMAVAFGVFANGGVKVPLTPFQSVRDPSGKHIPLSEPKKTSVLNPGVAFIISDILSDNAARIPAFGPNSTLQINGRKVAVKTGTTNEKKDNWTIGYTSEYLVVVWVGNNDNTPMHPTLTSGITGASPIWNRIMRIILEKEEHDSWFEMPESVVAVPCGYGKTEYYLKGTEHESLCVRKINPSVTIPGDKR